MNLNVDKAYVDWIKSLKPKTASAYLYGPIRFCEYTGKTPTNLINEARIILIE